MSLRLTRTRLAVILILAVAFFAIYFFWNRAGQFGHFEGEVVARWHSDGRTMTLTEAFAYVAPDAHRWDAPSGEIVDGASIPRVFWSIIGGPFEGQFRNASVVHDVACDAMTEDWQRVHRMFYTACRCGGVPEAKAKMMYYAVYNFGPRWHYLAHALPDDPSFSRPIREETSEPSDQQVRQIIEFFRVNNPSIDDIEQLRIE